MLKRVIVLGSTGSVGRNALNLLSQYRDSFKIVTLVAKTSVDSLARQAIKFQVDNVVLSDKNCLVKLKNLLCNHAINIYRSEDKFLESNTYYDIAIVAISGVEAIKFIDDIIPKTKILGLANKESIVCAGELILQKAKIHNTTIIPLDSEHNAIWQLLEKHNEKCIKKITLTASGGPFLYKEVETYKNIRPEHALKHPNWKMGSKISIDSSNMLNKGFELIEACLLFNLKMEKVDAIIQPQSLIHGMVHYNDGSILSYIAEHNMQIPISTVLNYPYRTKCKHKTINLDKIRILEFQEISRKRFPLFFLAQEVFDSGITARIILTIANEIAVDLFLRKSIGFLDINSHIMRALDTVNHNAKIDCFTSLQDFIYFVRQKINVLFLSK